MGEGESDRERETERVRERARERERERARERSPLRNGQRWWRSKETADCMRGRELKGRRAGEGEGGWWLVRLEQEGMEKGTGWSGEAQLSALWLGEAWQRNACGGSQGSLHWQT